MQQRIPEWPPQSVVLFCLWWWGATINRCNAILTNKHAAYVMDKRDNAIHVIYEFPELEYARSDAWTKVLASMPSALANQIDTFSTQNKLLYIPSGLQGPYVREWDDINKNIARFVHRMYLTRYQLYNSISSNDCLFVPLLRPFWLIHFCPPTLALSTISRPLSSSMCNNIWDLLNLCFLQMSCASVYIHELHS